MSSSKSKTGWKSAAVKGAIIVHPLFLAIVFCFGAIAGMHPQLFHPNGPDPAVPRLYGIQGGFLSVQIAVIGVYIFTIGLLPLLGSLAGALVGIAYFFFLKLLKLR